MGLCLLFSGIGLSPAVSAGVFSKKMSQNGYTELVLTGDYAQAAEGADGHLPKKKRDDPSTFRKAPLIAYLMAGNAYRLLGDPRTSLLRLDAAEMAIKDYEMRITGAGAVESIGSMLLGAAIRRYRPKAYDGILTNTYKALNFMAIGDMANARVEFNRADERTRRAVEIFAKEIAKEQTRAQTPEQGAQVQSIIDQNYPELARWSAYPDFVNPYVVFLHGVYFFATAQDQADIDKGRESFERVAGMNPDNAMLRADLSLIQDVAAGKKTKAGLGEWVWLICEDGAGPSLQTKAIQFPVSVDGQYVTMVLSLPELVENAPAYGGCAAQVDGKLYVAEEIGSMDRVAQTEFKKRLPREIALAFIGMLTRAGVQAEIQKGGGKGREILAGIYQQATSVASTSCWPGLPKTWHAVRVPRAANGEFEIASPDGTVLGHVTLPPGQFTIVHARLPAIGVAPALSLIALGDATAPQDASTAVTANSGEH
jgi:uncharacterized protein